MADAERASKPAKMAKRRRKLPVASVSTLPPSPSTPSSASPPSSPTPTSVPTAVVAGGSHGNAGGGEGGGAGGRSLKGGQLSVEEKLKALSPLILRELKYVESRERFMPGEVKDLRDTELSLKGSKKSQLTLRSGKKLDISLVEGSFRRITGIREQKDDDSRSILRRVEIERQPGKSLGFFIREGDGWFRKDGIFVSRVNLGSSVQVNGLLGVGDEIIKVNNVDVTNMSLDNVVLIMQFVKRLILTAKILTSFNFKNTLSLHKARELPKTPSTLKDSSLGEEDGYQSGDLSFSTASTEEKRERFKKKKHTVESVMKMTSFGASFIRHFDGMPETIRKPSMSEVKDNPYEEVSFEQGGAKLIEDSFQSMKTTQQGSVKDRILVEFHPPNEEQDQESAKASPTPRRVIDLSTGKITETQQRDMTKSVTREGDLRGQSLSSNHPYEEIELSSSIDPYASVTRRQANVVLESPKDTTNPYEDIELSSSINPYASVTNRQGKSMLKSPKDNTNSFELSSSVNPYASVMHRQESATLKSPKDTTNPYEDIEVSSSINPYASVTNHQRSAKLESPKKPTNPYEDIDFNTDIDPSVAHRQGSTKTKTTGDTKASTYPYEEIELTPIKVDSESVNPYASVTRRSAKPTEIINGSSESIPSASTDVSKDRSDQTDPYESVSYDGSHMKMDSLLELLRTKPIVSSSPAVKRKSDIIVDDGVISPDHIYARINRNQQYGSAAASDDSDAEDGDSKRERERTLSNTTPPPLPSSPLPVDQSMDLLADILRPLVEGELENGGAEGETESSTPPQAGGVVETPAPPLTSERADDKNTPPPLEGQVASSRSPDSLTSELECSRPKGKPAARHISESELEGVEDTPPPLPPPYVPDQGPPESSEEEEEDSFDSGEDMKPPQRERTGIPQNSEADLPMEEECLNREGKSDHSPVSIAEGVGARDGDTLPVLMPSLGPDGEEDGMTTHPPPKPGEALGSMNSTTPNIQDNMQLATDAPDDEEGGIANTTSSGVTTIIARDSYADLPSPPPPPTEDQEDPTATPSMQDSTPSAKNVDSYSDLLPPPPPLTDDQVTPSNTDPAASYSSLPPSTTEEQENLIVTPNMHGTAHGDPATKKMVTMDSYSNLPPPPHPPTEDQDEENPIPNSQDNTTHGDPAAKKMVSMDSYSDLPPPPQPPVESQENSTDTLITISSEDLKEVEEEEIFSTTPVPSATRDLLTSTLVSRDSYSDLPPPPPPPTEPPEDEDTSDSGSGQDRSSDGEGSKDCILLPTWSKEEMKELPTEGQTLSGVMVVHVHGLDATSGRSREFWARYDVKKVTLTASVDNSVKIITNVAKVEDGKPEMVNTDEKAFRILLVRNSRLTFSINQVCIPNVLRTALLCDIFPVGEEASKCIYVEFEEYGRLALTLERGPMSSAIGRLDADSYNKPGFLDLVGLNPNDSGYPLVLERCIEVVEQHGMKTPHLYQRCTPSSHRHRALAACIHTKNSQSIKSVLMKCSIHAFTGLIIEFFCDLPEPFLTNDISSSLTQVASLEEEDVGMLDSFLLCLPEEVAGTLQLLLVHFRNLLKHSASNGVTVNSLSRLFGPLLLVPSFYPNVSASTTVLEYAEEYELQAKVLRLLLSREETV